MEIIIHRVNSINSLNKVPKHFGVEVDIRAFGSKLVLNHEPYQDGEDIDDYLDEFNHGTLILNIKEVGIELYYKLLKETIRELKSTSKFDEDWSPIIKLGFPISIPENYISDLDLRLNLYRKISNINNISELNEMLNTLTDRFGNVPVSKKKVIEKISQINI